MNIYFSGIGGVAIGPLAQIARDAGHTVAGSDLSKSLVTRQLEESGVTITYSQDGSFLQAAHNQQPIDWFIYTAALPADHPELITAQQLGIKTGKRDELINEIITKHNLKLIAIAGTHGKTFTTGMLVWTLKQLGVPVSYSIGSTINFGPSGHYDANAQYFVYECDEFDRNFLRFSPSLSLITSVDYDHPDTYPTTHDYLDAFQQFINNSQHVIMWQKDAQAVLALPGAGRMLQPSDVIESKLAGHHNRENATLVAAACEYLGLGDKKQLLAIIDDFPGTARRFEKLADGIYSDYGHHPTEITATLAMAKELSAQVTLVYQPHQNVRQHQIKNQYTDCMVNADNIYWLPTYLSREDPNLPVLTPSELSKHLVNQSAVKPSELNDELWRNILQARTNGSLVVVMGAGNVDAWLREKIAASQID